MRARTIASGLLAFGIACSLPAHAELVMSAPAQLSAGNGSTLLLRYTSSGDLDPSTQPVVTVEGSEIHVELNDECAEIYCDVLAETFFRVELPPLAQGEYTVTGYSGGSERGSFTLTVGAATALVAMSPAEGFWMPVDQPGTGLHLQHRGDTLAVSQFDQVAGDADWRLDAVPLHGDSAIVLLRDYSGGSCFGCTPHTMPVAGDGTPMRISFASARTATAELADGTLVPLLNLAFGADYVPVELAPDDALFGSLALPDLSGRWVFRELRTGLIAIVAIGPAEIGEEGVVEFSGSGETEDGWGIILVCSAAGAELPAGCMLSDWLPGVSPGFDIAFAALGDVTEERIRFRVSGSAEVWEAVRMPASGTLSTSPVRPAEGFWSVPGQPGTGMHFQNRGELLAVSQFDFLDGESHWRLGVAPLLDTTAGMALQGYSGGSCLGCTPHVAPVADAGLPTSIVVDSARRATVDLGDGTLVPLVNVPFGSAYVQVQLPDAGDAQFGPLALPDLSGTWAFDLQDSTPGPRIVTLHGPVFDGNAVRFARDSAEGEQFALICKPGNEVAHAGCELHIGDLAIGTPPPGWYPFAELGDVQEDRIRFVGGPGESPDLRVFYAVRVAPPQ